MRVFCYWNLHRGCWSVKALDGPRKGRVVSRGSTVLLSDVKAKVSEAGRQRVLREKRKNVHAGIVGRLVHVSNEELVVPTRSRQIGYNPYHGPDFVDKLSGEVFDGARWALLQGKQVHVTIGENAE